MDEINAFEGDRIEVTARCSVSGSLSDDIIVGQDNSTFPEANELFNLNSSELDEGDEDERTQGSSSMNRFLVYGVLAVAVVAGFLVIFWDRITGEEETGLKSSEDEKVLDEDDKESEGNEEPSDEDSEDETWHSSNYRD